MREVGEEYRQMLDNIKKWMDAKRMAIDSDAHPELLTELRTAQSVEDMTLNKSEYTMDLIHFD